MLEFEVEGVDDTIVKIKAQQGRLGQQLRDILAGAARLAEMHMKEHVPRDSDALAATISIDESAVSFSPGGFGGGGIYEVEVKVGEGVDYLRWVVEGTGPKAGHGPIHAISGGPMMITEGEGKSWIAFSEGQRAQSAWITDAQQAARRYIERKLQTLAARGDLT